MGCRLSGHPAVLMIDLSANRAKGARVDCIMRGVLLK